MYYVTLFAFEFSSLNQNNGLQSTLCPALTIIKTQSPLEIAARARRFYIPLRALLFTFPQTTGRANIPKRRIITIIITSTVCLIVNNYLNSVSVKRK